MSEYVQRKNGPSSSHASEEQRKRENQERKRSILYLILAYFKENHLKTSYETLKKEAQLTDQYTLCDNIDLDIILQEFQSYYNVKFQRDANIIRRTSLAEQVKTPPSAIKTTATGKPRSSIQSGSVRGREKSTSSSKDDDFQFEIISMDSPDKLTGGGGSRKNSQISEQEKKPLTDFSGYSSEWREFADVIMSAFIPKTLGYCWEQCIGLEKPVELLKEATIYPLLYPELFENLTSWSGILLYGPPGTGKTLLAKALACEGETNFINVTSSSFISKWRGDSEKMIKVMFDVAKFYAPTTIFIDEIDALLSESKETNHEASCRFKSELLIQMDGLLTSTESVFLLATTNSPWKLDKALLRRFEKRILIPLPNQDAKLQMLKHYCKFKSDNKNDLINLNQLCKHFSGSDIKNVGKEMEISLVREQLKNLHKKKKITKKREATLEDLVNSINSIKPSINMDYYMKIVDWHEEFGSE